ncbi:hypothetical protein [uncultured Kordia sp.]|uniref:hypothetical protein n=1 Tax=uncultured Kordia sp. TaxID=507699 RepID=UPI002605967D|nr:hypothetical protein [uncultured Kordia sp.]
MATTLEATMTIPKNGKNIWTDMMQNPSKYKIPQGITEGNFLAASYAQFSDGVFVFGGVAVGTKDFNYPLFMVFDKDYNQIGGWPIDPSDWEDFQVNSIEFAVNDAEDPMYTLNIVEAS